MIRNDVFWIWIKTFQRIPDPILKLYVGQAGLEKTRVFKKKTNPVGFFGYFLFFLGFLGFLFFLFFYILVFAQKREFLGFFQFQEYFYVHPDVKL